MHGRQHLHKPLSGKYLINLVVWILVMGLLLSGCEQQITSLIPGPGRSDWELPLIGDYTIIRINSRCKCLSKETDNPNIHTTLLQKYYVTRYYICDPYIFLEGIPTKDVFASEEEKKSDIREYYLFNVQEETQCGPYDTVDALLESDFLKDIDTSIVWEQLPG